MSFQPVLPMTGFAGWSFLTRTREAQQKVFEQGSQMVRDTAYFKQKIGGIETAEQLVADRRLLKVALGAFGLDQDIDSRYYVRKVLQEGTLDSKALANRLSDKRYQDMARAFGFDLNPPRTKDSGFGDTIVTAYKTRQFEVAVGEQSTEMRLALGFARDLGSIVKRQTTDDGRWYGVMGNTPVRKVFETALGLPASFGKLDLDLQLQGFRDAAERAFGDGEVAQFSDPEVQDKLIRLFLVRTEAAQSAQTAKGQLALSLLQSVPKPVWG